MTAPLDEVSLIWLGIVHYLHYLQILDQWDLLYAKLRIDVSGKPISKMLTIALIMLWATRAIPSKNYLKWLKNLSKGAFTYRSPMTLTLLKYSVVPFTMVNLLSMDRIYYLRWQGIERLAPLEFRAPAEYQNNKPLYYQIRSNMSNFEMWTQYILALWNILAFLLAVTMSIMESSWVLRLQ